MKKFFTVVVAFSILNLGVYAQSSPNQNQNIEENAALVSLAESNSINPFTEVNSGDKKVEKKTTKPKTNKQKKSKRGVEEMSSGVRIGIIAFLVLSTIYMAISMNRQAGQ